MPRTYHRIGALHPYESNWCIKAKVTRKGPLRSISIRGADVAIFNVDLVDDSVGAGGGRDLVAGRQRAAWGTDRQLPSFPTGGCHAEPLFRY